MPHRPLNQILIRLISGGGLLLAASNVPGAPRPPNADTEAARLQQEQQRQQLLQQQQQPQADVRLDSHAPRLTEPPLATTQDDTPCFPIQQVALAGDDARHFRFALSHALSQTRFTPGTCLGAAGINRLMTVAQNKIIDRGYTTTRILAAPQDLNSGILTLTVVPGKIRHIRFDDSEAAKTHVGRIVQWQNELPAASGRILNLRHLEQGLENLKRVPTAEADIQIVPAEEIDESDIVIRWRQRTLPIRLSLAADDSGSKATGKYQGSVSLSLDNPLGMSDLFYVSAGRDLGHKTRLTDMDGGRTRSGTHNYALHYSVPLGNWLGSFNHSRYRYHQAVAGAVENYDYNGSSSNSDIGLSRMMYRDARRKTQMGLKLWTRTSDSFINDAEIEVQRRRTGGWMLTAEHKEYIGPATVQLNAAYKRGTGLKGSLESPEEAFGEGTSRMRIITAQLGVHMPFRIKNQAFHYESDVHAQWNQTPLTPQDKLAIGGRYTVRGFDGETSLSAERGWYWRNTLAWHYRPAHQVYAGVDTGRVSGPSAEYLLGQNLTGAVIGLKGRLKAGGQLYYDVFAGKPLAKPQYFRTANTTLGFALNYSF
ncbi:hemolysin activation/secretion protein [Neisseria sp. HSC-16F19]|nr:ShlB/FhaC/HecB family hemolysin secretion/activation protein [Neisseria sp. HSC-16F19]MCP2040514.1 hemolysin activation/secretion protein [Neisseria sp. HSC-16F19]